MYTAASRLRDLASIIEPEPELARTVVAPQFEHNLIFSSDHLDNRSDQLSINMFDDGSMIVIIYERPQPMVVNDMMELKFFVTKFSDPALIHHFAGVFAELVEKYISNQSELTSEEKTNIIVFICERYRRSS